MLIVGDIKYTLHSFIEQYGTSHEDHLIAICAVIKKWLNNDDYIEITTSGSTSTPKKIRLAKHAMKSSAIQTQNYFKYKSGDKALLCIPVRYIGGMMMLIRSIISDLDLYIVPPSLRPLVLLSEKLDFVPMTPAQLSVSLEKDQRSIDRINKILLGGGPVSLTLQRKIINLKTKLYHSFGMTETISHIAIRQLNHTQDSLTFYALDAVQLEVDDESCLIIKADYIDEPVYTNDVVNLISPRKFTWKGRKDNVINSGGLKLYPELIEQKLSNIIDQDFFVIGTEDEALGSKVCLVIETDHIINESELRERISEKLEKYERPKLILSTSEFQKTETGKIKRSPTLYKAIRDNKVLT